MAQQLLNSLKTINNIQRDGSLQDLLLSIKQARADVEKFSKSVADQKAKLQSLALQEQKQKELEKQQQAQKEEPQKVEKKEEKIFSQSKSTIWTAKSRTKAKEQLFCFDKGKQL